MPQRALTPATDNCSDRLRASQGLNVQSWASSSCCSSIYYIPSLTGDGYQAQESANGQAKAGCDRNGGADAQGVVLLLSMLALLQPTPCPCCCQHSGVSMHMLLRLQTHACHLRIVSVDIMMLCMCTGTRGGRRGGGGARRQGGGSHAGPGLPRRVRAMTLKDVGSGASLGVKARQAEAPGRMRGEATNLITGGFDQIAPFASIWGLAKIPVGLVDILTETTMQYLLTAR